MTLVSYVHVTDDKGEPQIFGPEDDLPEWAARKIGAHCFVDGDHPFPDALDERPAGQEPSRAGKGSSREAWLAFAAEKGKTVSDGATRDQIINGLIDAGVIEK